MKVRKDRPAAARPDILEVVHHVIPDTPEAAGALPGPGPAGARGTWRRMLRGVALAEALGFAGLLAAGAWYGLDFFFPAALAALLYGGAAIWLPRQSKAGVVYTTVVLGLTLAMFGGLFGGWTGFRYVQSWFEVSFATLSVLLPVAGLVAAVATLRHRDGPGAARTPARLTALLSGTIVLVSVVASVAANDATRLPGDVTLVAANFDFEQQAITAPAGDVAIYFDNQDPFAHNIRIEGHGTSPDAAGRQSIRHVFRGLAPGSYTYICAIHPEMKGTLTVT